MLHARRRRYEPAVVRLALRAARRLRGLQQGPFAFVLTDRLLRGSGAAEPECASASSRQSPRSPTRARRIRADGPFSTLDFERDGRRGRLVRGARRTRARRARGLRVTGVLGLARRDGNPPVLRPASSGCCPPRCSNATCRWRTSSGTSCFARTAARSPRHRRRRRLFSGLGPAKPDPRVAGHAGPGPRCGTSSSRSGALVPSRSRALAAKRFVLREEVDVLGSAAGTAAVRRVPLAVRSAVWDRGLLGSLFEFRLRVGSLPPAGEAEVRLVRASDPLPRPLRRPHRAAVRARVRPRAGDRLLVGGRVRAAAPEASSTRCARRSRLSSVRSREPHNRETAAHSPLSSFRAPASCRPRLPGRSGRRPRPDSTSPRALARCAWPPRRPTSIDNLEAAR